MKSSFARGWCLVAAGLFAGSLAGGSSPEVEPARAQDSEIPWDEAPPPLTEEQRTAAMALFADAKALLEKNAFTAARKKFREFLEKYPGADDDLLEEAEDRGGDNCLVGIELITEGGPPERRIDFELMGDGYTLQKHASGTFKKDAANQMKEFWKDPLYDEYASYFNIWRFDLISAEDGVDEMTDAEKQGLPEPEPENPRKRKKGPKKYSTALNCMAAGPARQVWADPEQVQRWRKYFKHSDGLTIAFAKKGELGMGGMGIATTGKRVAVVHEVGHAFIGLLDEYTGNPNPPGSSPFGGYSRPAPNSAPSDPEDPRKEPSLDEVPWRHWIDAGNKDVGLVLGGATYSIGMYRPAKDCAMNASSAPYCWVCREAGVLKIYEYVSPVDQFGPNTDRITLVPGETREFFVQPMAPKRHRLQVEWTLERMTQAPEPKAPSEETLYGGSAGDIPGGQWLGGGERGFDRRAEPLPAEPPSGAVLKAKSKKVQGGAYRSTPELPAELAPGWYRLTARVWDDAKVPGYAFPWVIKDPLRLMEERQVWHLEVTATVVDTGGDAPK